MTDPYTIQANNMKRAKVLDNRKFTIGNNPNTYDFVCDLCKTCVSYENIRNHGKGKKHLISLTMWYNEHSTNYDHENVLQIG